MISIFQDFLLQNLDDLLIVPVILIENLTIREVLDVLYLMENTLILENGVERFRFDANFKHLFSVGEYHLLFDLFSRGSFRSERSGHLLSTTHRRRILLSNICLVCLIFNSGYLLKQNLQLLNSPELMKGIQQVA